jgi:hypothetical protein
VTITIDAKVFRGTFTLPAWLSIGNIDDARALLSALLGAVSTVLALIFSVSLLVFSAEVTQFGPRLIHRFLRDRIMQITLGLFVAKFFHALLTFIAVRQQGADQLAGRAVRTEAGRYRHSKYADGRRPDSGGRGTPYAHGRLWADRGSGHEGRNGGRGHLHFQTGLHVVDATGFVHALLLRIQALLLPIKTLVLSGQ